jgi:DNA segregation ATPase FtsK/SpoIIIE, S-DNA-T family
MTRAPEKKSETGRKRAGKETPVKTVAPQKTPAPPLSSQRKPKAAPPANGDQPPEHAATDRVGALLDGLYNLVSRFQRFAWDFAGIATLALGIITLLALPRELGLPFGGRFLNLWSATLRAWFGYGSVFFALFTAAAGVLMLYRRKGAVPRINWMRVIALEIACFASLAMFAQAQGISLERAERGLDGGRVGWGLAELLRIILQPFGLNAALWGYLLVLPVFLLSVLIGFGLNRSLAHWAARYLRPQQTPAELAENPALSISPLEPGESHGLVPEDRKKRSLLPPEFRKKFRVEQPEEPSGPPRPRDERLPPLNLLVNEQSSRPDERNINLTAGLIEKTLAEFGIPARVVGFRVGPTVTQFAVEPGFLEKSATEGEAARQKVRVAQISGLSRDLALALSASRLRIEAPVPGRPYVGIEVPNSRSSVVRLRAILDSENFSKITSPLGIAMGRDVSGQPVVADLANMPHLLIAGTTGSGKSVCIAAITACLVMNNTPEDLRLIMIDPKMVELVRFNGLPHLYGKVETNLERILGVLRWTVAEMDRRYKLLEEMHARHIDSYNRKAQRRKGAELLPRLVVMIDELADLMMSAPEQTEPMLVRLAQLARATGIHLVVATQRPSTDVVTGLIKANFPARVSFAVASSIDSRVIIDTGGAEALLGHGDMLFLPPEAPAPIRSQGVMITDQEIERVINFWQKARPPAENPLPPWDKALAEEEMLADRDDLITKAIAVVRETRKANPSLLQRRLRIGYPRAARLMDELEEMGIIGPGKGREREVLIGEDDSEEDDS